MSKGRGSNLGQVEKRISKKLKFWNWKMVIASVTAISFPWGTTSRNRYFIIIEFWNFTTTTASVTSISCGYMLHFISQCLSLSMASYHTVHAFPLTTYLNGSLMVSNPSCHAKGPRFEWVRATPPPLDPFSGRRGLRVSPVKLETLNAFYGHSRSFAHPKPCMKNDQRKKIYNPVLTVFR